MARLKTLMTEILTHEKQEHMTYRSDLQDEIISRYGLFDVFKEALDGEPKDMINHLALCTILCTKCPDKWFLDSIKTVVQRKDFTIVKKIIELGFVALVQHKEHYVFDKEDFEGVADKAVTVMSIFNIMLDRLSDEFNENDCIKAFISRILSELLYLVIEHINDNLWTSALSVVMATNILRILKLFYKCEFDEDFLTCNANSTKDDSIRTNESTVFSHILKILLPRLAKENWKTHPGAKSVFQWCLFHTSFPNLNNHLEKVLPPSLIFVDDYILENKIAGIQCLHHIMENVTSEELRWYGRADVIYQALKHQLYTNDAALNEVSYPAILSVLGVVEKISSHDEQVERKTTKHDEIWHIILQNAECENKIALRQIATKTLIDFVEVMGLLTVKHLRKILDVIDSYLQTYEGPEEVSRINVLNLLEKVMKSAWPRIPCYMEKILKMLLKFVCNLAIQKTDRSDQITVYLVEKVTTCIKLLKLIGGDKCVILINSLESAELPPLCIQVLEDVKNSVDSTG